MTYESSQPSAKQEHRHSSGICGNNGSGALKQVGEEHCPSPTDLVGEVDVEKEGAHLTDRV